MKFFTKKIGILIAGLIASYSMFVHSNVELSLTKQNEEDTKSKIEHLIGSYVSNHAFEGTILVSKSSQIIFEKAYGFTDRANNKQLATSSSFQLASLSKPITAAMVLMLEEQGRLKLDDTLADYFPEYNNAIGKKITLHHLLSHTSGIPNHFVIEGWFDANFHKRTSEQEFVELIAKLPLQFDPGVNYLYSNLGYFLLGKIIEHASGESYSTSVQKYIFVPLSMSETGVASGLQLNPGVVKGYQWKNNGGYQEQVAKNMTLFGAGAAIFSNVEDLYRFDLALYDNILLNDKSKLRLFNPEKAYSWRVGSVPISLENEIKVHTYDGEFDGYSAMMTRFVDDKHSIILLSNVGMSHFLKQQLTFDIAAVLYNQEVPNRENDASLTLIKSVVSGEFDQTLNQLQSDKLKLELNEQSLSSFAFQLLWSNLADKSLQIFSFISNKFSDSSTAKKNLLQACNHRLARSAKSRVSICN